MSSDREESSYNEYYTEMPWLRLAYSDRARKAALSSTYKVNGIPCLILLDPSGETITAKGVEKVMGDTSGACE